MIFTGKDREFNYNDYQRGFLIDRVGFEAEESIRWFEYLQRQRGLNFGKNFHVNHKDLVDFKRAFPVYGNWVGQLVEVAELCTLFQEELNSSPASQSGYAQLRLMRYHVADHASCCADFAAMIVDASFAIKAETPLKETDLKNQALSFAAELTDRLPSSYHKYVWYSRSNKPKE